MDRTKYIIHPWYYYMPQSWYEDYPERWILNQKYDTMADIISALVYTELPDE